MVVDSLHVGGAERHVADLAARLHGRGYDVTVACSTDGLLARLLEQQGVPVRPLMKRLVKRRVSSSYARALRALLGERKFDLVHAHLYGSVVAAAVATLRTGVPLVVTEHSEAAWRGKFARLASRWVYGQAAQVIAVSRVIGDRLVEEDGVTPSRIAVIPNAVSSVLDGPAMGPAAALPHEWREGPLVGIVARLQPEKGARMLLEAVPRVLARIPTCHFLLIGDGPLRGELERRVRRMGLEHRVHFLGFQANARSFIERLDVLVLPSLSEGAPLVILEAMAAGVPIVASEVGGIPEQIRHGREGLLVEPGDPAELAEACLCLLQNPVLARELGEAGRSRASSYFDYETMVRRIELIYEVALGRAARVTSYTGCK